MSYLKFGTCFKLALKTTFSTVLLVVMFFGAAYAQGGFGGLLKKANIKINLPKVGSSTKSGGTSGSTTAQPIFDEKNDYKNVTPSAAETDKYFKIGDDFYLDIGDVKKQYPSGYAPQWAVIGKFGLVPFNSVNYFQGKMTGSGSKYIGIDQENGKTYAFFGGFHSCSCACALVAANEKVVINNQPQTFFLKDFVQITSTGKITDQPCKNMHMTFYDTGGWKMKLTLSIDNNQALLMNATVASLTTQQGYINKNGTDVSTLWTATDVVLPNLVTVENAVADKAQHELNIKNAEIRRIAVEKKHVQDSIAFEVSIKNSFVKLASEQNKYPLFNLDLIKTVHVVDFVPGKSETVYYQAMVPDGEGGMTPGELPGVVNTPGKNIDYYEQRNTGDKTITIKGIRKNISPGGKVYYEDASITLGPGEATEEKLVIESYYNAKGAEIGSVHYYKNKIVLK